VNAIHGKKCAMSKEELPTCAKNVGNVESGNITWSNEGEYDDEQDTNIIDLSAGEDDLPSIIRTPKAKNKKFARVLLLRTY
jgi:hypothetical protein